MNNTGQQTAIFAAGCFWGVQYYFDQIPGVTESEVGYIGGKTDAPNYEDVCHENTGHAEAVKVSFDSEKVSFEKLLKQFFRMHDPTQLNRQGPDVGTQYRSAIFPINDEQKKLAELEILNLKQGPDKDIMTSIEPDMIFWPAEEYHQKFTEKTGRGMCHIPYAPV
ncbi:MAG: peptide-methionine (S)-S-oxide reductase MsrA [bacterium]|nr:peptide-methionine (S)-S-oxide reductase MsrA [bacterium]